MPICFNCNSKFDDDLTICPFCGTPFTGNELPEEHPFDLKKGSLLNGRYAVGRKLNYGGFGVVYKGSDIKKKKLVAIKEFFPQGSTRNLNTGTVEYPLNWTVNEIKKLHQRFEEESEVVKDKSSTLFPQIFDFVTANGTCYIIMEFIDGVTIKHIIKNKGKLKFSEAINYIYPLLEALNILHQSNFLHRDVKPENVILNKNGVVQLIDFGAAREFDQSMEKKMTCYLTKSYAPLEQFVQKGKFGPQLDVYAVGASAYHMLTGTPPPSSVDIVNKIANFDDLHQQYGIDKNVEKIIRKCMETKVEDRYQSIDELKTAFDQLNTFKNVKHSPDELTLTYEKEGKKQKITIHQSAVFGRTTSDFYPDIDISKIQSDGTISRRHGHIFFRKENDEFSWYIEDLKSTNGIFVNGAKIDNEFELNENDVIRFGKTGIQFVVNNLKN